MPDNNGGDAGSSDAFDISSILSPGTSGNADTAGAGGAGSGESQDTGAAFKWGGKEYKSQAEAEQAHNKLYGKYSEQQSTFKQLKEALKNPKLFAQFSKDPAFSSILAKLGIQQQEEEVDAEIEGDAAEQGGGSYQQLVQDIKLERATSQLEREEWRFERQLGRPLTKPEREGILNIIEKAPSLSYEMAWKLANHDRLLKEAAEKAAKSGPRQGVNRPPPTPLNIPGVKLDTKKGVGEMNQAEWREHLRASPEFQNLFNNGR